MRGTQCRRFTDLEIFGIIPAYAGNTFESASRRGLHGDHPRVCGEHANSTEADAKGLGSSPRMRGTPCLLYLLSRLQGIIPAYAGNTPCAIFHTCVTRDHPRVCGEHDRSRGERGRYRGSSPRMRGTLHRANYVEGVRGIIPAYAGNTPPQAPPTSPRRDHPRVCGEHRR